MESEQSRIDWIFVARWVVFTTLTIIIGTVLALWSVWTIGGPLFEQLNPTVALLISGAWAGGVIGLGLGIGQALALRGRGIDAGRWVLHSVIGSAAGFALSTVATEQGSTPVMALALVIGGLIGLCIGIAQWLLLRGRLPGAAVWVAVTAVAFVPVALLLGYESFGFNEGQEWAILLIMGLVAAGITGLGAAWLFGRGRPALPRNGKVETGFDAGAL